MGEPDLSKLSATDRELLYSARWSQAEIIRLLKGANLPPNLGEISRISDLAEESIDYLSEVLDVETPSHIDNDREENPQAGKPSIDEQTSNGQTSEEFAEPVGRLFVGIGHNKGTGARSIDSLDEWETSLLVGQAMVKLGPSYGIEVMLGIRDRALGYGSAMAKHGRASDAFKADAAIEIHRNAYNGKARGFEAIHASAKGKTLARFFAAASDLNYENLVIRADEGALDRSKGGNGRGFCRAMKAPGIVVEPCFFDNAEDWPRIRDHVEKEARTYLAAARAAIMFGFSANPPHLAKAKQFIDKVFPSGSLTV